GEIRGAGFAADGETILSLSADRTVRRWDLTSRKEVESLRLKFDGLTEGKAFSADGRTLVSVMLQSIPVWDVEARQELRQLNPQTPHVYAVACTRDGRRCIAALEDVEGHVARVWDLETGKSVGSFHGHRD